MIKSRVTEILGIEYPVICGAMSWCTDARLCAAISNAGGLGQLAANAGQTELTSDPAVTVERMKAEFEKTLALTDKPFAVNCMTPNPDIPVTAIFSNPMRDWLLTEDRAKIIVLSGAPCDEAAEFIRDFKKAGKVCIYRDANPVASSFKWAEDAGADIVIATGIECGGHLSDYRVGLPNIMQIAKEAVSIPVVASGGIVNAAAVKAVYDLGAEGVYIGTLFLCAEESPVAQNTKEAIINSDPFDCVEYRGMSGFMRCIRNELVEKCEKLTYSGGTRAEISALYGGGFRTGMRLGDHVNGIVCISAGVGQIHKIEPVADQIAELVKGME